MRAVAAGANSVVVANNVAGVVKGTLGAAPPAGITAPAVGISLADGHLIQAQAAPVSMVWTNGQSAFPNPTASLISSFSSYGLAPTLDLKPDVGAPGGSIYSTYPLERRHTTLSGTSMSSPHVAGAVALMLQANPALKPLEILTGCRTMRIRRYGPAIRASGSWTSSAAGRRHDRCRRHDQRHRQRHASQAAAGRRCRGAPSRAR